MLETFGKYQILSKIGQGAMGEVFRARDTVLSRDVAVKTILSGSGSGEGADDTLQKRFLREAQSAARLNHPNIITVYEFGQEHGRLFMAMELLEGSDLKRAISERAVRTLERKLDILSQVAEGLAFAHQHDVVHRDLKPANVHLKPDGQVKIVDFGLARLAGSDMTRTGMVMGTPHYMAPEQVRGERADTRSDVFSLGCIAYELLSTHKPFDSDSMHAVLFKVLQEDPRPIRELLPDVPLVLEQVVEASLDKDPEKRFQDAGQFLAALNAAREHLADGRGDEPLPGLPMPPPPSARPKPAPATPRAGAPRAGSSHPSVMRPAPPPPPSSSLPLVLILGGLLALGGGGFAAWLFLRGTPQPPATPGGPPGSIDDLARAVVGTQVELARRKLEAGDYREAKAQAERALKLDPQNAGARQVFARAAELVAARDTAERDARQAAASGDMARAADALWKLMGLEPDNPAVADLGAGLQARFEARAAEAKRVALEARTAAERAGFAGDRDFARGAARAREAEAAAQSKKWAAAAAAWLGARDAFVRAKKAPR